MALKNKSEDKIKKVTDEIFYEENLTEDTIKSILNNALKGADYIVTADEEKYIAVSSDVSGGKSTFLNAVCRYPIFPASALTTGIRPVELCKVSNPEKEHIEIYCISEERKRLYDDTVEHKTFSKKEISPEIFDNMCTFVDYLFEKKLVCLDSLRYFENASGSYSFDRNNWRHNIVLLMILFNTYLHEDKRDCAAYYKVASQMKEKLFIKLGIEMFNTKEYGVRLYWCSDLIPNDAVLVEMPGFYCSEDSLKNRIVNNYLIRVSSLLFLIDSTGNLTMEAQTTLDLFLSKIRSQRRDNPELVTFLMNKADRKDEEALQSSIKAFRDNYKNYADYALYPISAISGERLFISSGIDSQKTFMASKFKEFKMSSDDLKKMMQVDDTVAEDTGDFENSEEENMNEDTVELLVVPGTRAFTQERIRHLLDVALKRDTSSPIINIREKKFVIPENVEKHIAISGDVSGGKSTFLNAICRYPICPSAETTTSICPVELRRVAFPEKERIEICYISKGGERLSDKTGEYKVFSKMTFSPALFNEMCAFVNYLIEKRIIKVDSLRYFENAPGSYCFDRNNWRHTMVLLMILFDTYLHEDKKDSAADYKVASQMKEKLFTNLGLKEFNTKEYGVRLYWCSDLIPADTVIVDLPGTGSATEDSLHTRIVNNYLIRVSSLLFLIDSTGNLTMEAQTTLDLFLSKIRSQRRDNPELVTFLMNKADRKDEEALQSSIKAFRDNYKNYADYALYAVSAISGEWLFMASGIDPQKTFMASKYKALRIPVNSQTLLNGLEDAYTTDKYPYSLNGGDLNYNSASLSEFVGEHIEEYIRKLNFRGTVNLFDDYIKYLSNLCRTVMESIDILINASGVSGKLGAELKEAVYGSLREAQNKMDGNRSVFADDIKKLNIEFSENLDAILESFNDAYESYNEETNRNIKAMVQRLEMENGKIYISQNFLEIGKESAISNRKRLIEFLIGQAQDLAWKLTTRTKYSKFGKSFILLEEEFERERKSYSDFLDKNIDTLLEFPAYAEEKMNEQFEKILSDNNVPTEFFEQTKKIIANVCNLLTVGCEEFADNLMKDSSFEDAIIKTTEMFYNGLSEILSPYTREEGVFYTMNVLEGISKNHWFRADFIAPDKLNDFLSNQYISDFSSKFEKTIEMVFRGMGTGETGDSHLSRLMKGISKFTQNISNENMKKFTDEVRKSCILLDNMGQPEEINKKLGEYLSFVAYIKNAFAENGHYRDIIDYIEASDESALKESRSDFAAIEKEADAIAEKISHFEKVGANNE